MLGNGNIRLAPRQTEQRTHNDPLSNVSEVAKRRCNRQQHRNDCWNPDAVRDPLIYGCFHVQSRIYTRPVEDSNSSLLLIGDYTNNPAWAGSALRFSLALSADVGRMVQVPTFRRYRTAFSIW